jgi:hypothetical protein
MRSRKGTVLNDGETKAVYARVQIQSRAGKLAARYDHGRGVPQVRVSSSMISRWRQAFQQKGPELFADQRDPKSRAKAQGYEPGESPDELKRLIGDLPVQNDLLKKSRGLLGK